MKKRITTIAIMLCLIWCLCACGDSGSNHAGNQPDMAESLAGNETSEEENSTMAGESDDGRQPESGAGTAHDQESGIQEDVQSEGNAETVHTGGDAEGSESNDSEKEVQDTMRIQVGDVTFTAELADNSSVDALKEKLAEGPLTIDMQDYANMEKVGSLGFNLPTNDEQISTGPGDLILYLGNSFVIYYDTNSWNFTRLGKIKDVTADELKEALGSGDVTVTLSME